MKKIQRWQLVAGMTVVVLLGGVLSGILVRPAKAIDIGDILKVGGVLLVVSQFGNEIDHFINNLMGQKQAEVHAATKVVPILSVGQGAYIGAAQVMGVPEDVKRVQAVAAVDGVLSKISGTLLVPISTKTASGTSLNRVQGVGVSAVIDLRL
ncbi:MAG: hypothetical protein ACYDBB_14280 [Armatimonadota bacterium]